MALSFVYSIVILYCTLLVFDLVQVNCIMYHLVTASMSWINYRL